MAFLRTDRTVLARQHTIDILIIISTDCYTPKQSEAQTAARYNRKSLLEISPIWWMMTTHHSDDEPASASAEKNPQPCCSILLQLGISESADPHLSHVFLQLTTMMCLWWMEINFSSYTFDPASSHEPSSWSLRAFPSVSGIGAGRDWC